MEPPFRNRTRYWENDSIEYSSDDAATGELAPMSDKSPRKFGGVVLCGGESTRMGQPKLSLPFGAQTMLERVVSVLQQVVSPIVVVAVSGQQLPDLGDGVIIARDEQEGFGPLGGLVGGLALLRKHVDAAYVSSCDVPLLTPSFVQYMIDTLGSHDVVMPRDGKYHHPLAAVYRTSLEDKVRSLIAQQRLRPFFLLEECDSHVVDVDCLRDVDPNLNSLRNCNTPEEYQSLLAEAGFSTEETGRTTVD